MTSIERARTGSSTNTVAATNLPRIVRTQTQAAAAENSHNTATADSVSTSSRPRANEDMLRDSGPPPLPWGGPATLDRETADALSDFMHRTHEGSGVLMWEALVEMAKSNTRDMKTATELKIAMVRGKTDAKKNEITATEGQSSAERGAAANELGYATAATAATYAMTRGEDGKPTKDQGAISMATTTASLINTLGKTQNKVTGPQREADEKKAEASRHEMMKGVFEANIESAKSTYDGAREQMKLAIKLLNEHAERQTRISGAITRV